MKRLFYFQFIFFMLILNSCSSQGNKSNDKDCINDTIDYGEEIKYDRSLFLLVEKDKKPQDEIILKNKNKCFISFPSKIACSDTIVFYFYGTIVDNNDNPIINAKIELLNMRNGVAYTAFSDSSGDYSINAVIDKPYTFRVSSIAFYSFTMTDFEPICDEVRNVNIHLQKLKD